jgi:riboflavin kinase/FMN adenylyltransferase
VLRLNGTETIAGALRGGVAALGNFDGVHLGHRAVIGRAVERARSAGVPALVVTFDPHPARLFRPDAPPFALTTMPQRLNLIETLGVDAAVVIGFDAAFAGRSADDFIDGVLKGQLGLTGVVTGEDFTFGKGRAGDAATLARHFTAEALAPVCAADGGTVSSTRIRQALQAGDPQAATALLTRPFTIRGTVEHGDKRGRTIDFPTANVVLGDYLRPAYGVYAVRARLPGGAVVDGVANLGVRPMFTPPKELLEVFLFDWSGDLYGAEIDVELVAFLRPEWKLDGLAALKAQIAKDCAAAKVALDRYLHT